MQHVQHPCANVASHASLKAHYTSSPISHLASHVDPHVSDFSHFASHVAPLFANVENAENAQHVSCATKCANMQLTYVCTKGKMRNRICGEIAQNAKQGKMHNMRRKTISLVSMCYVVVYMYIYIKKQILYILRTYATPEYIYMCICIYIYIHTLSGHLEWRPCVATLTGESIRHCPSSLLRDPRGMF